MTDKKNNTSEDNSGYRNSGYRNSGDPEEYVNENGTRYIREDLAHPVVKK